MNRYYNQKVRTIPVMSSKSDPLRYAKKNTRQITNFGIFEAGRSSPSSTGRQKRTADCIYQSVGSWLHQLTYIRELGEKSM